MDLLGKHILSSEQFDCALLDRLFSLADTLQPLAQGAMISQILQGAVLGSLFFEASTRTRLSFDSAFLRLGGAVSQTTGVTFSSMVKGESLEDTSRVISGYVDVLVVRHADVQAIHRMAAATHVPIINAGNGDGEHPTQALLDIYTLRNELAHQGKTLNGVTVALAGDLRYGRTIHSLLKLLLRYPATRFILAAPQGLGLPDAYRALLASSGHHFVETDRLDANLERADIIYMTRVQKERLNKMQAQTLQQLNFRLDAALARQFIAAHTVIMHPLPRDSTTLSNDLSTDLDGDPRLAIFRQSDAGVAIRMALFAMVMGVDASSITAQWRPSGWWRPAKRRPIDIR